MYISRLRAKLEPPGSQPLIATRQRAGYLIPAEERGAAGTGRDGSWPTAGAYGCSAAG